MWFDTKEPVTIYILSLTIPHFCDKNLILISITSERFQSYHFSQFPCSFPSAKGFAYYSIHNNNVSSNMTADLLKK